MLGQFYIAEAQKAFREDENQTEWQLLLFVVGLQKKMNEQNNKTKQQQKKPNQMTTSLCLADYFGRE